MSKKTRILVIRHASYRLELGKTKRIWILFEDKRRRNFYRFESAFCDNDVSKYERCLLDLLDCYRRRESDSEEYILRSGMVFRLKDWMIDVSPPVNASKVTVTGIMK